MEPPVLSSGDLRLRPKRLEDADALTVICQDPEIQRWTLVPSPYHRDHAVDHLLRCEADHAAGRGPHLVAVDADDLVLGSFSLMSDGEIGYFVAADARGRGVGTRALILLRDWALGGRGLPRVELLIDAANGPSRRIAEKAGFALTDERRRNPRDETELTEFLVYRFPPAPTPSAA